MELTFDFHTEGDSHPDAYLEAYELEMLFEQMRQEMTHAITRKLGEIMCETHGQAPNIRITAGYDHVSEQMDVSYHVDACCKPFMMRVVQVLHHIG